MERPPPEPVAVAAPDADACDRCHAPLAVVLRLLDRPLSRSLSAALGLELPARTLQARRFAAPWGPAP